MESACSIINKGIGEPQNNHDTMALIQEAILTNEINDTSVDRYKLSDDSHERLSSSGVVAINQDEEKLSMPMKCSIDITTQKMEYQ
jgi:hypothetical protein